jgi:hypothetical protein
VISEGVGPEVAGGVALPEVACAVEIDFQVILLIWENGIRRIGEDVLPVLRAE